MPRVQNLQGQTFGRLTVTAAAGKTESGHALWAVECSCGTEKTVRASNLKTGTRSCGCLRLEGGIKKRSGESARNSVLGKYKASAKRRKYCFSLTENQFFLIIQKSCFYCGSRGENVFSPISGNGDFVYTGIDRVNNNEGYTISNVVPCCTSCNVAKASQTQDAFIERCKEIARRFSDGG